MLGVGTVCMVCGKEITQEDIDDKMNGPVTISNLPGFYHKLCKVENDMNTISNARVTKTYNKLT